MQAIHYSAPPPPPIPQQTQNQFNAITPVPLVMKLIILVDHSLIIITYYIHILSLSAHTQK